MSGAREPTEYEQEAFRAAISNRDEAALRSLVIDISPHAVWGSVTKTLDEADQKLVRKTLKEPATAEDDWCD